ncbi:MAG: glycosyltransferase [Lachnospiraceae bacterium]|nr:glycosyltransferase [Lachnospiraceae bacterium]
MRCHFREEIKRAEDPYAAWIEQNEGWRGTEATGRQREAFAQRYHLILPEDAVNDPDLISQFALAASRGDYDLIYCDEDVIRDAGREQPYFKPDYSPDTLQSYDYIGELRAISREFEERMKKGDNVLPPEKVFHIPKVLYHRLKERDKPPVEEREPEQEFDRRLSIVVLSKDHPAMLKACVDSLVASGLPEKTEMVLVDNGSTAENRLRYESFSRQYGIRYYYEPSEFNYSALCNFGAGQSGGEYLLFLNDDIVVPKESAGFLHRMCRAAQKPYAGAVGIKLRYPESDRIQHCGITMLRTGPSHKLCGYDDRVIYEHGVNWLDRNVAAVTGACLLIRRERFLEAGGFDESLPVAYNDVDLCLCLLEKGYFNISMNSLYLYHYESATRRDDRSDLPSYERLKNDRVYFEAKHGEFLEKGDPYYSSCLTKTGLDYRPDINWDWEESGVRQAPLKTVKEKKPAGKIFSHMDRVEYKLSDAYGNEDFVEAWGWIFKRGQNLKKVRPGVLISMEDKKAVFEGERVYRKDVAENFKKDPDACFSGFIVRIAHSCLKDMGFLGEVSVRPVMIGKNQAIDKGEEACQIRIN